MLSTGFRRYTAVILGLLILGSEASADRLPNFVIVFTDDQGYGDLGCFGRDDIETPNLDRMAREGMRFTDCLLYTSPSPRDKRQSRMPSSA